MTNLAPFSWISRNFRASIKQPVRIVGVTVQTFHGHTCYA